MLWEVGLLFQPLLNTLRVDYTIISKECEWEWHKCKKCWRASSSKGFLLCPYVGPYVLGIPLNNVITSIECSRNEIDTSSHDMYLRLLIMKGKSNAAFGPHFFTLIYEYSWMGTHECEDGTPKNLQKCLVKLMNRCRACWCCEK